MIDSVARVNKLLRQRRGGGHDTHADKKRQETSRLSTQTETNKFGPRTELGLPIGREGNDYPTPDYRDTLIQHDPGKRLQDFANTHLSEGPNPGRIPHFWNDRRNAKLGREITGNPTGDTSFIGTHDTGDGKFIMHTQIPRGSMVARAFARTVDDAANVPAVYVGDPTRR